MKKTLLVLALCTLFVSMSVAGAVPQAENMQQRRIKEQPKDIEWTGEILGSYGIGRGENHTVLGTLEGNYKTRIAQRMKGFFLVNWTSEDGTKSGQIRGIYGRRGLIGKISGDGYNQSARIIGFLRYNDTKFIGRIMSWVGPAVYIYGDHWTL
jgi:hypothetical protein